MPTRRRAPQSVPDLPAEMIVAIVRASKHGATLVRLRQVCKAWRRAIDAESASLWREAALERFPRIREFVAAANLRAPCYRSMYRAQIEAESAICLPRTYLDAYVLSAELQVREHSEEGDGWRRVTIGRGSARLTDAINIRQQQARQNLLVDEGAIILTMMQPAYDNLEKELDLDSWHEKLCLKFFVTRVSDMKSVVISDLSHPNRDLDDGSFVFEPEHLRRIPELFAHDEGNPRPREAGMKATFFAQSGASEMQVNLSFYELDARTFDELNDYDFMYDSELLSYLQWYAPWPTL
jgi:hypothetical protein